MAGKGDDRRPTDPRHALDCSTGAIPHAMPDGRGFCWRCGQPVAKAPATTTETTAQGVVQPVLWSQTLAAARTNP